MTKAFSNDKSQTLKPQCYCGFCNFFYVQVNCILHWRFHVRNEIPVNYLFTKWECTYILDFGPWSALNMGFCEQAAFKNTKTIRFWKLDTVACLFQYWRTWQVCLRIISYQVTDSPQLDLLEWSSEYAAKSSVIMKLAHCRIKWGAHVTRKDELERSASHQCYNVAS